MRLWHEFLLNRLPYRQLLGQHRECCALRGKAWGRKHSTVDYVFRYSPYKLFQYHALVIDEMKRRGYHPSSEWLLPSYRGKTVLPYEELKPILLTKPVFSEHDKKYFRQCLDNLAGKGIIILETV